MIELDDHAKALRDHGADLATDLREHAMLVDTDPYDMKPHLDLPAYELIRYFQTPPEFSDGPVRIGRFTYEPRSVLQQVVLTLELAYGDAGMALACPSPSLAGVLVDHLGDDTQREWFHRSAVDSWTFFAVTEPGRGSDATALETRLDKETSNVYRLTGAKRYIGNGERGSLGVVLARTGPGPLSVRAALVQADRPGFHGSNLDMIGLRGACLGEITLDDVEVPAEMLLGRQLPATRRGMWGAIRVFNIMRANVAALAVGTGLALVDLVRAERADAPGSAELAVRLEACRRLVYAAGAAVDHDRDAGTPSSTAKIAATALAREASRWAVRSLGAAALVEIPLLEKWTRDVCAFEFMEGTSDIQRQHVARAYLKGRRQ
ncbi:acyl-CoA dehydrogenase family protein [Kibdelosporangium lantanae]